MYVSVFITDRLEALFAIFDGYWMVYGEDVSLKCKSSVWLIVGRISRFLFSKYSSFDTKGCE